MHGMGQIVRSILLSGMLVLALIVAANLVQAHGSMQTPISRIYHCFLEGPESPQSEACRDAVASGGTQPLYDWNEVNLAQADGRHRELIPDGQLCSAGRDKYSAFDQPRADWPAQTLTSGASYTFRFRATAPHRGAFELYITRDGYNPTQPLRWSDLEAAPFSTVTDPPLVDGAYVWTAQLPQGKSGRHLIYAIWQRSDSPEAFYSCSDVVFGDAGEATPTATPEAEPTATLAPTASPTSPPTSTPPEGCETAGWQPGVSYQAGQLATYDGIIYAALQSHTSQTGWEPPNTPALWEQQPDGCDTATPAPEPSATATPAPTHTPSPDEGIAAWQPGVSYQAGQLVSYEGATYSCIQSHTSQTGWEPPNTPALWSLQ